MVMSLQRLLDKRRLRRLPPGASEISDLLRVVERDIADAGIEELSADRRFATAYNAALQLATVVLRAEGYRTEGMAHHHTTIQALPLILGAEHAATACAKDQCDHGQCEGGAVQAGGKAHRVLQSGRVAAATLFELDDFRVQALGLGGMRR